MDQLNLDTDYELDETPEVITQSQPKPLDKPTREQLRQRLRQRRGEMRDLRTVSGRRKMMQEASEASAEMDSQAYSQTIQDLSSESGVKSRRVRKMLQRKKMDRLPDPLTPATVAAAQTPEHAPEGEAGEEPASS